MYSASHCYLLGEIMFTKEGHQVPFLIKFFHIACLYLNANLKYTSNPAHITRGDE